MYLNTNYKYVLQNLKYVLITVST